MDLDYAGKKITVLGARQTGLESALFLKRRGAHVFVSELKESAQMSQAQEILDRHGIPYEFGRHTWDAIKGSDLIVISPGIPPSARICQNILQSGIPMWSEIELAYRSAPGRLVAVTGTNGKTTVTTLIRDVLREAGVAVISCGNIGNPFISEIEKMKPDTAVLLEVSSFQLSYIDRFKPQIAVLLNLSPNHLDWHENFERYAEAKWRIFENQTPEDFAVVNTQDPETAKRIHRLRARIIYFNDLDRVGADDNPNDEAVRKVANLFGVNAEITERVLKNFQGLEHRLELAGTFRGVRYVNDSKSTTIASLGWALDCMETGCVLISGGRHKGGNFRMLRNLVHQKVKYLITIGEARKKIEEAFGDLVSVYPSETLLEALRVARTVSEPGDTVLFSPACASFDMFQDYQDRGLQFKKILESWRDELAPTRNR